MKREWKNDFRLEARMILTMFLLAAIYFLFLSFIYYYFNPSIFVMGLLSGSLLLIQYFFSDKMVLMTTGAKIVSPNEAPELHEMVTRLCAIADLPVPRIAVMNTQMPNAFATGRNHKNAIVAVTTGITQILDKEELEAVIGHELSHIKNRDMAILTFASFISTIAFFIVRNALYMSGGDSERRGNSIIVIWIVSMVVWIISFLLLRALSRYREYAADRGASVITGKPSKLASALMKISGNMQRVPQKDLRKAEGMNAFFIIPAISGSSLMELLSTHPSTEKRIRALENIQRELQF